MKNELEKTVHAYMQKILELQKAKENQTLSQNELKRIALDMGLSEADWEETQQTIENHFIRGENFAKHNNWKDAIYEFEQVVTFHPQHSKAILYLAKAYFNRWEIHRSESLRQQAEHYAKWCLHSDPANNEAAFIISELKKQGKYIPKRMVSRKKNNPIILFAVMAVAFIMIIIGFLTFFFLTPQHRTAQNIENNNIEAKPTNNTPTQQVVVSNSSVPVHFKPKAPANDMQLQNVVTQWKNFSNSYNFKLAGDIYVSNRFITDIDIKIEVIDLDDNAIIVDFIKPLRGLKPKIRSGDVIPVYFNDYVKNKTINGVKEVKVTVENVESEPAKTHEPSKPVIHKWATAQPNNLSFIVSERSSNIRNHSQKKRVYHTIHFEFKNTGKIEVNELVVNIQWYDKNANLLTSKKAYIVSKSSPVLRPVQTRVFGGTWAIENTTIENVDHYEVAIINVKTSSDL